MSADIVRRLVKIVAEEAKEIIEGEWGEQSSAEVNNVIAAAEEWLRTGGVIWTYHEEMECDYWECSCGEAWVIIDGSPKENNYNYCPSCGEKIIEYRLPDLPKEGE
jgi:hypothetical protein